MHFDKLSRPRTLVAKLYSGRTLAVLGCLLLTAYIGGCMVGQEQERDLQKARQLACETDPHCLRP